MNQSNDKKIKLPHQGVFKEEANRNAIVLRNGPSNIMKLYFDFHGKQTNRFNRVTRSCAAWDVEWDKDALNAGTQGSRHPKIAGTNEAKTCHV